MAFLEVEMVAPEFNRLVQFIASTGPIPVGTLAGLGLDRLIAEFLWNDVEVGASPPGYNTLAGTVTARCTVTLRHVSTAELDADPNAAGSTIQATAWVNIATNVYALSLQLLAIQVPNSPIQWFTPPKRFARMAVPNTGFVPLLGAALLLHDNVVTLRFATRSTDQLLSTPLNLVLGTGDEWAIRMSGELFADQLLEAMQGVAATLPADTSVEDQPSAHWGQKDGHWVAIGSIGFEKKDACKGLLADVDMSATVNVLLTPSVDLTPPPPQPPQLNLNLHLSTDASDWDSLRCWFGTGGIVSALFGYVTTPLFGPGAGGIAFLAGSILSLIAVAETVRLDTGKQLEDRTINNFTKVSGSSTTATYTSQNNLPSILRRAANGASNGTINTASTGAYGVLVSGTIFLLAANHNVSFIPNGGALTGELKNKYDCGRKTWTRIADIQNVEIQDKANLLGEDLWPNPVEIFPTTVTRPDNLWSVIIPAPDIMQIVTIKGSDLVKPADTGRVYLHTSAGIRRFDIAPMPDVAPPTQDETIEAVVRCLNKSKVFTPVEKIGWLVDPPPFNFRFSPLRQWLFTFSKLTRGTIITVQPVQDGKPGQAMTFRADATGEASFELVTDANSEILVEHNQDTIAESRVLQRWLMPVDMIDIGEQGNALVRSGSTIAVMQPHGLFTYNLATAMGKRQAGNFRLSRSASGQFEVIRQTRQLLQGAQSTIGMQNTSIREVLAAEETALNATPFSLTLPGGKVAALFNSNLVIGVPGEESVYVG